MAESAKSHIHESPRVMTAPLIVLALGSIFAGWLSTPEFMWGSVWDAWLQPILGAPKTAEHAAVNDELFLTAITLGIAALGIFVAFVFYGRDRKIAERASGIYKLLANKYYVDEFYDRLFVRPFTASSVWLARRFDPGFIDGIVNGVAASVRATSLSWRRLQSGNVQHYLFAFLAGTLLIFAYFLRW